MSNSNDMPTLSIIVVSYNTRELLRACLDSVYRETRRTDFELIVVDNASSDQSVEMVRREFPKVKVFALQDNVGFARANNEGARAARGEYLLLLNPDTEVLDDAIDKLVGFARENPRYGLYGGATRFADGSQNPTSGWNMATRWSLLSTAIGLSSLFRGSRLFNSESLASWEWDEPRGVDIVTGCFMLLTRNLWDKLGGFDEQFRMYAEDADLCLRAKAEGAKPVLCPDAEIIHHGGASDAVRPDKLTRLLRAKVQLFRKHWPRADAAYAALMLKIWALSRGTALSCASAFAPQARRGAQAWAEVWRRRGEWAGAS